MSLPLNDALPTWWEKTVEYTYVARMHANSFIAPLDGNLERRIGDATGIASDLTWYVIEFKRHSDRFGTEASKYRDPSGDGLEHLLRLYREVSVLRDKEPGAHEPHYFVFADSLDDKGQLNLQARPYWGTWMGSDCFADFPNIAINSKMSLNGCDKQSFDRYVGLLMLARSVDEVASAGSLGVVMGVHAGTLISMSLNDYAKYYLRMTPAEPSPEAGSKTNEFAPKQTS